MTGVEFVKLNMGEDDKDDEGFNDDVNEWVDDQNDLTDEEWKELRGRSSYSS